MHLTSHILCELATLMVKAELKCLQQPPCTLGACTDTQVPRHTTWLSEATSLITCEWCFCHITPNVHRNVGMATQVVRGPNKSNLFQGPYATIPYETCGHRPRPPHTVRLAEKPTAGKHSFRVVAKVMKHKHTSLTWLLVHFRSYSLSTQSSLNEYLCSEKKEVR